MQAPHAAWAPPTRTCDRETAAPMPHPPPLPRPPSGAAELRRCPGSAGRCQQLLEGLRDACPALGRGLKVWQAVFGRPRPCVRRRHPPSRALVGLVPAHRQRHGGRRAESLRLAKPPLQALEGLLPADVKHQQCRLRVPVELVPHLKELRAAAQVPEVHSSGLARRQAHGLDAKIHANGHHVLAHEPALAKPFDEAALPHA
mmetsp:Transcript_9680/g.37679  ORF Transcript_9680/g.37679 Transcript_9680/m.37679 type:complete len:201 (-) Transcript_9680:175-777(-)